VDERELLDEQRAYYRGRAPDYDDWWMRRGIYDRGRQAAEEWAAQVAVIDAALAAFGATGDVLELAGGTGWWTERLAATATSLTVLDASAETLERNRARVQRADVEYVVADLFDWRPERTYDVVFFSFWLSHVPRPSFARFWALVRSCLHDGGRAFLVDNHTDPVQQPPRRDPHVVEYRDDLHLRRLADGSEYRVVKVMYEPAELEGLLDAERWHASIGATRWFLFGSATPA